MERSWNTEDKECLAEGTESGVEDRSRNYFCPSCPVSLCTCANTQENNNSYPSTNNNDYSKRKRTAQSNSHFYRSDLNPPSSNSYDVSDNSGSNGSSDSASYYQQPDDLYRQQDSSYDLNESSYGMADGGYGSNDSNYDLNNSSYEPHESSYSPQDLSYNMHESSYEPQGGSYNYPTEDAHYAYGDPSGFDECSNCSGASEDCRCSPGGIPGGGYTPSEPPLDPPCQCCQYNDCGASGQSSQSYTPPKIQVTAKILFGSVSAITNLKSKKAAKKKS